ncbi:MAG: acetyl-CoA C-acyltransferase [Flavobacteriales bacterium]|jgi:acetyl-CoA acyltransferase|nr:acetyl-CoA C-acyltransferase [Flavobacteriales bacterium]|tara:strand:+ start:3140 stop:4321 length:1182 start_codon:yes stop_codon:yes gene_type:complete
MEEVYIVQAYRTAVGKSKKGKITFVRPDDLGAQLIEKIVQKIPNFNKEEINDIIVGNATPEAEQGLNIGRMISLIGLNSVKIPGITVNRYCSSGLETIAIGSAKIKAKMSECIIAGGVETMSNIPMGGWKITPNYQVAKNHPDWYWGMGTTAEAIVKKYQITRIEQDEFAYHSHMKAVSALKNNLFKKDIIPIEIKKTFLNQESVIKNITYSFEEDEGPRQDTTIEKLGKLKPVFAQGGTVTAGNSSQTSNGAAFVMLMSEKMIKKLNIEPIARLKSYAVCGVEPKHMGIGPVEAIPLALKQANMSINDIELIELNEAFACQALAVIKEAHLNPDIINVNGGAIALGHPLGCTGAKLTVQLLNEMKRRGLKNGMVTMCVGTGQGAAGIFELLN